MAISYFTVLVTYQRKTMTLEHNIEEQTVTIPTTSLPTDTEDKQRMDKDGYVAYRLIISACFIASHASDDIEICKGDNTGVVICKKYAVI
jgi:hypothetical protein